MLAKVFAVMVLLALGGALFGGDAGVVGSAALSGAKDAVSLTVALCGSMALFSGLLEVLREAGAIRKLSVALRPFLRFFFPDAYAGGAGSEEVCAAFCANLLGMGNAATPFSLAAMKKLQKYAPDTETAAGDAITFAVFSTAPLCLLPTNLIAMREAAGSAHPFDVLPLIWLSSLSCALLALALCRMLRGRRTKSVIGASWNQK